MVKSRYIGDGHPTFWYIKRHYWVDDHPLLYGNNWSLDPSTSDLTLDTLTHSSHVKAVSVYYDVRLKTPKNAGCCRPSIH